jgi:integrase
MSGTTPPPRRAAKRGTFKEGKWNESRRPRGEYLTRDEVEALWRAAGATGRNRLRDSTMVWVGFVHGLRAVELVGLKIEQYDFRANRLSVVRVKNGRPSVHPIEKREKTAIRELIGGRRTGHVFVTEGGKPMSQSSFLKIMVRAGELAVDKDGDQAMNFPVHPHMLRHSCGYWLNEQGKTTRAIQDWLGHKNIRHTERYTANSPEAFKDFHFD